MNRSDDEPPSIEHRGCYERAAAGPQVPRKTGVVVTSLAGGPAAAEAASAWSLVFDGFDQASEGIREALCTLGNGYFATRAAASWAVADGVHYPGTYLAGGYNRLRTDVAGRVVENEDLVNFPNWLPLNFHIADDGWFDARTTTILSYRQELDLQHGILLRTTRFEDQRGRRTLLQEQRLVSMADMHLGAMQLSLTAENWSGSATIRSAIDGRVVNAGAKLYRHFNGEHLEPLADETVGNDGVCLVVRTSQSHVHVAQVARTQFFLDGRQLEVQRQVIKEPNYIGQELTIDIKQGQMLVIEKLVSFYTSRDQAISECGLEARKAMVRAGRFNEVKADHLLAWDHLWQRFAMCVSSPPISDSS
jgi:trehalose/maltose hydrolase-like predicted phosphorylase